MKRQKLALFGGGPSCLMAALQLSKNHEVHLYEQGKTIGRKFLVAGKGGFNLTNQAFGNALRMPYKAASHIKIFHQALDAFDSKATQNWLANLGIGTFIGSSGRVFPEKGIKPAEVLQKIKEKLIQNGVSLHLNHAFVDFDSEIQPIVMAGEQTMTIKADHYFFGLGGGSWKKTGSNDQWFKAFEKIGVKTTPFQPSNCGICLDWSEEFRNTYAGTPLKNIALKTKTGYIKGEALITNYGLEGNAIYPISAAIREALDKTGSAGIEIDFKPNNSVNELIEKVAKGNVKPKNYSYVFNLSKADIAIMKQCLSKSVYLNPKQVAKKLKGLPLAITGLRDLDEAISTVGGIPLDQINANFALHKHQHISIIGEMLDWDAPTGGFLLQGCFSTAYQASLPWQA